MGNTGEEDRNVNGINLKLNDILKFKLNQLRKIESNKIGVTIYPLGNLKDHHKDAVSISTQVTISYEEGFYDKKIMNLTLSRDKSDEVEVKVREDSDIKCVVYNLND